MPDKAVDYTGGDGKRRLHPRGDVDKALVFLGGYDLKAFGLKRGQRGQGRVGIIAHDDVLDDAMQSELHLESRHAG